MVMSPPSASWAIVPICLGHVSLLLSRILCNSILCSWFHNLRNCQFMLRIRGCPLEEEVLWEWMKSTWKNPGVWRRSKEGPLKRRILRDEYYPTEIASSSQCQLYNSFKIGESQGGAAWYSGLFIACRSKGLWFISCGHLCWFYSLSLYLVVCIEN